MERRILELHLVQAEAHIAVGKRHIARQRALVAKLERDGHDPTEARRLLDSFEELQAMHIAGRDRLQRELTTAPPPATVRNS
jgi:hypothetical protein